MKTNKDNTTHFITASCAQVTHIMLGKLTFADTEDNLTYDYTFYVNIKPDASLKLVQILQSMFAAELESYGYTDVEVCYSYV